jgi:hypothetical protein
MGDAESLLLVLSIIYLAECLVWVRRGATLFTRSFTGTFRPHQAGALPGNSRGGIYLSWPLPPLGTSILPETLPFCLSPEGILARPPLCLDPAFRPSDSGDYFPWESLSTVAAHGRSLLLNDRLFVKSSSAITARRWAEGLNRVRKAAPDRRAGMVRAWIDQSLDVPALKKRHEACEQRARSLRVPANVLFGYLYLLAPGLVSQFGMNHVGWPLLAGLLVQTFAISLMFGRAHRALYPGEKEDRFRHVLTMLLSPPTAIRAHDILSRHSLEAFHALAAANVLCSPSRFKSLARRALIDLQLPPQAVSSSRDAGTGAVEHGYRGVLSERIKAFVLQAGYDPAALVHPAPPMDPAVRSYCPRCGQEFLLDSGHCQDCGGQPLVAYPMTSRVANSDKSRGIPTD